VVHARDPRLGLLAVSMLVAYQRIRGITRSLTAAAVASRRLAHGDLTARAPTTGPPEVRQVGTGLNLLAGRIGELLVAERERVADLSHRVRTPLTALRIDAESLTDPQERARLLADLDRLEHTVDTIIWQARRPTLHDVVATCDAAEVVTDRVGFWTALADEEQRDLRYAAPRPPMPVRVGSDDLAACVDTLLGNAFTHTPEGAGIEVQLYRRPDWSVVLIVSDQGPGLPDPADLRRGRSGSGSTGLGLDIVGRVGGGSGGTVRYGTAAAGGARIVVEFGRPDSV
jgi:signal transduction histidine kinase